MPVTRFNIQENTTARDQFIAGVHLLKTERIGDEPSTYDSLVIMHHTAMHTLTPPGRSAGRNAAHSGPVFLPWHRFFLLLLESHIQRVLGEPTFGLPYWDWVTDGELPASEQRHAGVWSDDCLGPLTDAVSSGPFRTSEWRVNFEGKLSGDLVPVDRGLRRRPTTPFNLPVREDLIQALTFDVYDKEDWGPTAASFRNAVEGRHPLRPDGMMHNRVHQWVGLDMIKSTSPNDPVFFLHHATVDRIWATWMAAHPDAGYAPDNSVSDDLFRHRLDDQMHFPYTSNAPTPRAMLDVSDLYQYDRLL